MELISENAEPTIIVIEVELYKPFFVCNVIEDFERLHIYIVKLYIYMQFLKKSDLLQNI